MSKSNDASSKPICIGVWDASDESLWSAQFERLLRQDGSPQVQFRKIVGKLETIPAGVVRFATDLLVFVVPLASTDAGCEALRGLRNCGVGCPALVLSDADSEGPLLQLIEAGASDFLALPLRKAEVFARLARWSRAPTEVQSAVELVTHEFALVDIIGQSAAIRSQIQKISCYAKCDSTVLISGETGTGKEVFARAIHYVGRRSPHPFLPVNCAALPIELVENELFGHEAGAFTGARRVHHGLIQQAEGGTVFLDEVDSLPMPAQAKLLRFLQEREYRPLGAARTRRADVRVISASNGDLSTAVRTGRFRQDLFFRLNVLAINLPPLRDRPEDIPLLASHLLSRHAKMLDHTPVAFTPAAISRMLNYDWPGNIRELENIIERALVLSEGGGVEEASIEIPVAKLLATDESFKAQKLRIVINFERRYLSKIMAGQGGNITRAAKAAGKDRRAFFELLRKHDLTGGSRAHQSSSAL
jgi:two-component system, NtrC family, response regulator GlrR